jgi:hypothetical protein
METSIKYCLIMAFKSFCRVFYYLYMAVKNIICKLFSQICSLISKYPKAVLFVFGMFAVVYSFVYIGKTRAMENALNKSLYETSVYKDSLDSIKDMLR